MELSDKALLKIYWTFVISLSFFVKTILGVRAHLSKCWRCTRSEKGWESLLLKIICGVECVIMCGRNVHCILLQYCIMNKWGLIFVNWFFAVFRFFSILLSPGLVISLCCRSGECLTLLYWKGTMIVHGKCMTSGCKAVVKVE